MATVEDVPAEHRHLAERMPADLRKRMDPAELRLRLAEVAQLRERVGDMPDPETAGGLAAHAEAMLKALPFTELEERCRQLTQGAMTAATTVDRTGHMQALTKLREENPQPRVMAQAARLADAQHGLGHLAVSDNATHQQLATAAQMIRLQRAAISQGNPPGATPTSRPAKRADPARERHEFANVTKGGEPETVPMLLKAADARPRDASAQKMTRADIVKAVDQAVADYAEGLDIQLSALAAEIAKTRAEQAGRTSTMGAPITNKMRKAQT
ncbi:hypothetical protein OG417_03275 [Actinoallomurus sp. NBC_01490]|uniref:hypothetical protein n=1 Tax=Actinoallomurus sp. NBC_01490 TaxID=2903557 RepID=UPI002E32B382|nr:hypothetical protein [Actinoallomurus sp. NBC_01490]